MKHTILAACVVVAMLAFPAVVMAQGAHGGKSGKTGLHVSSEVIVGTTTLKPGDYTFQCIEFEGKHYLVVKSDEGAEVARVPCEPETLTAKVPLSDFRSTFRNGKQYLTAVRIKGEMVAHRVAPNPAS
jgi:hypothetical protein